MADFFQNGVITTLQDITHRPVDELEADLKRYCEPQPLVLLLPALYSEFEGPAMPRIVAELKKTDYLNRIVLSLDRASEEEFRRAVDDMSQLPTDVRIIWNDGPRIRSLFGELEEAGFFVAEQGKGRGVWLALGFALADKRVRNFALHDCDIVNYDRAMLARLVYPIAHPGTDFEYSKGFYARVNEKLHGRVTRLFVTPLVRAFKRVVGAQPFFEYLDSFRYPLAGEFALIRSLATGIRVSPTWGLEISLLGEVFDKTTVERVCQVEIADTYEHKHQALIKGETETGLTRMALDIAKTLFAIVAEGGVVLSDATFDTLLATYNRYSRLAIEQYNALALLNGIPYDRHAEIEAVEAYLDTLRIAKQQYRDDPLGVPQQSSWARVRAALPDFSERLAAAVEKDNEEAARTLVAFP
jgi:glucosyl-3-phosphoglycerate synthase